MTRTEIIASANSYEYRENSQSLHLLAFGSKKYGLEIATYDCRHMLVLDAAALDDLLKTLAEMNPIGGKRPTAKSVALSDGLLVITYDNRGDPYAQGLRFSIEDSATGRDLSLFVENRDVSDFIGSSRAGITKKR